MRGRFQRGVVLFAAGFGGWDAAQVFDAIFHDRAGAAVLWTLIAVFQFFMAWIMSYTDSER